MSHVYLHKCSQWCVYDVWEIKCVSKDHVFNLRNTTIAVSIVISYKEVRTRFAHSFMIRIH